MPGFVGVGKLDATKAIFPFGWGDDLKIRFKANMIRARLKSVAEAIGSRIIFFGLLPFAVWPEDSKGHVFTSSIRRVTNELHRQFHLKFLEMVKTDNVYFFQVAMIEPFCSDPAFFSPSGRPNDRYLRTVNALMSSVSKGIILKVLDMGKYNPLVGVGEGVSDI